jgi:hypothetical protein
MGQPEPAMNKMIRESLQLKNKMDILTLRSDPRKLKIAPMKSAHKPFLAIVVLTVIVLYGLMAIIGS